ncbi:MAG: glutathione peroxidase [Flavobacteriales bacterium]|nr:glutathione peroxidase [Flavobacteriales bacterium]
MRFAFGMALFSSLLRGTSSAQTALPPVDPPQSFYALSAMDISGQPVAMEKYKGHKVLVVNTASHCGYTPQYAQLEELYQRYAASGLIILGFPSNNFLWQEPGSNADIATFCSLNYGVTFPMMGKVDVKGKAMHPVYQWLTSKARNGVSDTTVKWNFQKYLIDEQGRLIGIFAPGTDPLSEEVVSLIRATAPVVRP